MRDSRILGESCGSPAADFMGPFLTLGASGEQQPVFPASYTKSGKAHFASQGSAHSGPKCRSCHR